MFLNDGSGKINSVPEINNPSPFHGEFTRLRSGISFWMFGLCNNFAYVVILSAASDILHEDSPVTGIANVSSNTTSEVQYSDHLDSNSTSEHSDYLICNRMSTGIILLASMGPATFVALIFPFFVEKISYATKVTSVVILQALGFSLVAFSSKLFLCILGVVSVSLGSGMGEVTFLGLTSFYDGATSSWSSGSGGAGLIGSIVFAAFSFFGVSLKVSITIMLIVPVLFMTTYWFLLPPSQALCVKSEYSNLDGSENVLTLNEKINLLPMIAKKYIIPVTIVFFEHYFINQGIYDLLYFPHQWISPSEQYQWFQVAYQIGVFVGRSSVKFIIISNMWILVILQGLNVVVFIFQAVYRFIPYFWLVFMVALWEGLLGGAAYVNVLNNMALQQPKRENEFGCGLVSLAVSLGASLSGTIALPFHDYICGLDIKL